MFLTLVLTRCHRKRRTAVREPFDFGALFFSFPMPQVASLYLPWLLHNNRAKNASDFGALRPSIFFFRLDLGSRG